MTYKGIVSRLDSPREGDEVSFDHFYAIRGLNKYRDIRTLIVLGCPNPSTGSVISRIATFYAGQAPIGVSFELRSQNYLTADPDIQWAVDTLRYEDERLQSSLYTLREGELLQAIYRLRILDRDVPCSIWIFTEQPIPNLPVHLTGIGGFYCPVLDDRVKSICSAVNELLSEVDPIIRTGQGLC